MNSKIYQYDAVIQSADQGGAYVVFPYDIRAEFGKGRDDGGLTSRSRRR